MGRINLYRNVHKGQRALLFGLAVEVGRVDQDDQHRVAALIAGMRDALEELRQHSVNEETYIHPLLMGRAPDIAADLDREHQRIEAAMAEVEERLRGVEASAGNVSEELLGLYHAWCRMVSTYLAHIDKEECVAMRRLWQTCSDAEIFAAIREFVSSRSVSDQLRDLVIQAPALTPQERETQLKGMMQNPALSADALFGRLGDVLPAEALERLRADVLPPPKKSA